jgi:hypothetical protein
MIHVILDRTTFTVMDCGLERFSLQAPEVDLEPGHYRLTRADDLGHRFRVFVDDLLPAIALSAGGVEDEPSGLWNFSEHWLPIGALGPNTREAFFCHARLGEFIRPKILCSLPVVLTVL